MLLSLWESWELSLIWSAYGVFFWCFSLPWLSLLKLLACDVLPGSCSKWRLSRNTWQTCMTSLWLQRQSATLQYTAVFLPVAPSELKVLVGPVAEEDKFNFRVSPLEKANAATNEAGTAAKIQKKGKKRRNQDTLNFKDLQMPLTLPQKCGLHTFQILPVASRGLARSKWNTCQNQNFEQTSGPAWPSSVQLMSKRCLAETPRCYRVLLGGLGILKPAGPLLVEDVLLHNFKEW